MELFHGVGGTNAHITIVIIDITVGVVPLPIGKVIILNQIARSFIAKFINVSRIDYDVDAITLGNALSSGNIDQGISIVIGAGINDGIIFHIAIKIA